jgi:hypothetical protein
MSKYIKINQSKDNVTERKDLIDTLETNLETEQEKLNDKQEQLEEMQELDQAQSKDNIYKISLDILNKSNQKLAFNSGTIEVAKHFPQKEFKSKFTKISGVLEDYYTGNENLYNENAESCEACGDILNNDGICENPECDNYNIAGDEHAYILDKRNKYPQKEFDVDELDPYSDK